MVAAAHHCAAATRGLVPQGHVPAHAISEWIDRARDEGIADVKEPTVCEVGFTSHFVAQAFLCEFGRAHYVGLGFTKNSSALHGPIIDAFERTRLKILQGDGSRSVVLFKAVANCNVLVINMADRSARERFSLLVDLPNTFRRTSLNQSMVVLHGSDCPPGQVRNASDGCHAKYTRNCASRGDWCGHWNQLDEGGVIVGSSCKSDRQAGRRWCVGRMDSGSVCETRAPLIKAASRTVVRIGRTQPQLLDRANLTHRKELLKAARYTIRYLSVFPCGDNPTGQSDVPPLLCLTFKDHVQENVLVGMQSTDGGLTFSGSAIGSADLVLPASWHVHGKRPIAKMAHNLAILRLQSGSYVAIGGQHKHRSQPHNLGVWVTRGRSWRFSSKRVVPAYFGADGKGQFKGVPYLRGDPDEEQWENPRKIFDGNHAGCVERRDAITMPWILPGICEYDGRLSLVWFKGQYLLYARANPAAHGQRYVQLTRSTDTLTWSPFELVQIQDYRYSQGDLYFFAAQRNPVQPDSLVAVFPLVHLMRACIGIAFSLDGLRWSTISPLVSCEAYGDRAVSHPAAGLVRSGDQVFIFVHEEVPSVRLDLFTPFILQKHWKRSSPPGRIVRYTMSVAKLRRTTAQHLAELRGEPRNVSQWEERVRKRFDRSAFSTGSRLRAFSNRSRLRAFSNRSRGLPPQQRPLALLKSENVRLREENARLVGELAKLKERRALGMG